MELGKVINALYAIDGTCSGGCDDWLARGSGPFPDSNVKNFYWRFVKSSGNALGLLWEGPRQGVTGKDAPNIAESVFRTIVNHYSNEKKQGRTLKVHLIGWSRGAVIAVQVARYLNDRFAEPIGEIGPDGECAYRIHKIPVEWIGMFDAVNMTSFTGWEAERLPPNVKGASHAIKTKWQLIYPTLLSR